MEGKKPIECVRRPSPRQRAGRPPTYVSLGLYLDRVGQVQLTDALHSVSVPIDASGQETGNLQYIPLQAIYLWVVVKDHQQIGEEVVCIVVLQFQI